MFGELEEAEASFCTAFVCYNKNDSVLWNQTTLANN